MTKLGNMDLPKRGQPMVYCKICREWVPDKNKHERKRHNPKGNERK